ncbi:prepilin peptidase [Herbaspirillum sp.]|uniref:A24 family peptidase n=1 Tax=Herbaspirillum sp. TaxID=1890675 RepID=UPI001B29E294|nr:prepilin peptidase [Herbaspirillum sp.]MBO9537636.1 prepilin peptidase [Herbaspirillum sp.]
MQELHSLLQLLIMLATDVRIDVLFALLLAAAVTDYRSYRIPNGLTLYGALFALAYHTATAAAPWSALGWSAAGLGVGFFMLLPFYAIGVMGAGDVKLMAMAGAFIGLPGILYASVATFITGGLLALAVILCRRVFTRTLGNIRMMFQAVALSALGGIRPDLRIETRKSVGKLPYGISIGLGTAGYVVAHQLGYV